MGFLRDIRDLYSLETLDTRFIASKKTQRPEREHDHGQELTDLDEGANGTRSNRKSLDNARSKTPDATTSRWSSPEFLLYYIVILVAIPSMFKAAYDVSRPSHPEYPKYEGLLSSGWIPGRKVDNSDGQYSGFRDNVPYLLLLLVLHPILRGLYERGRPQPEVFRSASKQQDALRSLSADDRLRNRIAFDAGFGLIYIIALHGVSAGKILLILYTNYQLATKLPKNRVPVAAWLFNIAILFANELCSGYRLATVAETIFPPSTSLDDAGGKSFMIDWASYLDGFGGLIPRWEVLFKITILRLISFDLDVYWGSFVSSGSPLEKKQLDVANLSERDRVTVPALHKDITFRNYLAYVLYPPLYIGGPIFTFNDYISQQRFMPKSISIRGTVLYGIRFFIALLTMELMLHFIYAVAICKAQPAWEVYTPFQVSMLGYFNLHIIWLKLLLPWRFFRLWALLDGIDAPENMVRCMSDNYSVLAFWRGWHRSFNRWIVRYLYVPLGGSRGVGAGSTRKTFRSILNMLLVFTFVALWHDIQLNLLIWGWLITFFFLPELIATVLFPPKSWSGHPALYRIICGIGAVGNILMLMVANLVGFAIGLDGLKGLVHGIVGTYSGLAFLVTACAALFVGAQVMFEHRQEELRQGINMKC